MKQAVTTRQVAEHLGLTIDERIADGTYFANSLKILRKIFENPDLLDLPFSASIDKE